MNLTPTKATNTSPLASSERSFGTHFPSGSKPIPVPRPQSPTTSRSSHYINGAQRANESQRAPSPQPLNLYRDSSRSLVGPSKSVASSPSSSANSSPRSDSRSRHSRFSTQITSHGKYSTAVFHLPGVWKQDVHVNFQNDLISVSWKYVKISEKQRGGEFVREKKEKRYVRNLPIPDGTEFENIKATLESDRLTVTFPSVS